MAIKMKGIIKPAEGMEGVSNMGRAAESAGREPTTIFVGPGDPLYPTLFGEIPIEDYLLNGGDPAKVPKKTSIVQGAQDKSIAEANIALAQQKAITEALQKQFNTGLENQIYLAEQLKSQIQGEGPNPALKQLALTTGQNIAQQGAIMASARGAGANPGLIARQAAMLGGDIQSQAGGQAALLKAQQQLAAQEQLQQLSGIQVGQTQTGQQIYGQSAQNMMQMFMQAQNAQLAAESGIQQQRIAGIYGQQRQQTANEGQLQSQLLGGLMGGFGGLLGGMGGAMMGGGGMGPQYSGTLGGRSGYYAHGGVVKPQSTLGQFSQPQLMNVDLVNPLSNGGIVNGQAMTQGDSAQNDTVPAMLSPGEVVIPRTKVKDERQIAAFLNSLLGINLQPAGMR